MIKQTILTSLTVFIISACNSSDNKAVRTDTFVKPYSTSGYASVNGLKMYYEIHGSGAPLVLIHGGGSTPETTFGRVIPEFAKTRKVIAVDMQAHGHTADIDRPLSFTQDADDIAALLKELKIAKADVFGFSNGASTTLQFAIRHPQMTNKIIVGSTMYNKKGAFKGFWDMMSKPTFAGMPQPYKDAFLKINPDTNALHRMYERDVARMQSFTDIPDAQMKSIKAPAFIITGDRDVPTTDHAVAMQHILPDARLAIIPGGHGEFIGELTAPQDSVVIKATVSMINKFLSGK